jgi:ABC-type sugar transport system substrate-binding protein
MTRVRGRSALLATVTVAALFAAACGSDDKGSASETTAASGGAETTAAASPTSSGGGSATSAAASGGSGVDAAKAVVEKYRDPNQKIGVTKPLAGKPPKKTIAWLECELESCPYETVGMKAATEALGWDLKVISSKSGDPAPAFQTAIDQGVDFIASSGESPALYKEQAQAAKAKGIKILSCYDTTPPDPENSNIYTQCGDQSFVEKTGPLMADWAIADSNGKANVLIVSIPDFAVLKAETDAYKAELAKNCPDCTVEELNVSINDLVGGNVPAAVASKLQSNKDINYVFNSFGGLPAGLTAALKSAGLLDQVTVYGQDFSKFDLDEIAAGTMGAWSADPKAYAAWLMVDAAARLSLDMPLDEERAAASLPTFLVEDAETAKDISANQGGDWNPPNMAEEFKALWGV